MEHNRAKLDPQAALDYILQGHGKATLVGREHRYTYKFRQPEGKDWAPFPIFVDLLTGSDNESDYSYIGFVNSKGLLMAGMRGNPAHPAFQALNWYLLKIQGGHLDQAAQAEFWHEGTCSRCGRALTNPESIALGIGPVCAERAASR